MRFQGKHRVSKQDLKEDRFQNAVEKFVEAYYRDKQKFWIIGGIVLVVIVGAIMLIQNRSKGTNSEAQLRFTEALGIYSQGNAQQAEEAFKQLVSRFGKDYVGLKAHYYLGQLYYSSQRYAEGKAEFATFLGRSKSDPVLSPAAAMGIADCESELGNHLKSAEQYQAVAEKYPKWPLVKDAWAAAGRELVLAGSLDKAEALYQRLLDKKPAGEEAENLKYQLAYVKTLKQKF